MRRFSFFETTNPTTMKYSVVYTYFGMLNMSIWRFAIPKLAKIMNCKKSGIAYLLKPKLVIRIPENAVSPPIGTDPRNAFAPAIHTYMPKSTLDVK